MRSALLTVALSIVLAAPAAAQGQGLKLSFHDGLVSLDATNVPIRTILTEWGKIGGTKIVGAEKLAGAPLTLKLVDISEAKALETILRSAAGYMAAPRGAVSTGPSMYDRILVMATTTAPAPAAVTRPTAPNAAFNGTQRFIPPRPAVQRNEEEPGANDEPDDNPPNPPVFSFPPNGQPPMFNNAPPQLNTQPVTFNPQTGAPQSITITPAQPGTSPAMPAGASTPGVIVAPPQPAQPQAGTMIRPPGK